MLIDYLVMSGALLGGGSAIGLLILNRSTDAPRRDAARQERLNDKRGTRR